MTSAANGRTGRDDSFLPKDGRRPPKLAFAVWLYRNDILFRSLADFAVIGILVLLFTCNWSALPNTLLSAAEGAYRSYFGVNPGSTISDPQDWASPHILGKATIGAMMPVQIDPAVIAVAASDKREAIEKIQRSLDEGYASFAQQRFEQLDPNDPVIAYAGAIVQLNRSGVGRALEAQRLLRVATDRAIPQAAIVLGSTLFRLAQMHHHGRIPSSELVSLDGAGNAVSATEESLLNEAVRWWERAGHLPEAKRLLAMATALGLTGQPNLPAAIALWREAARRGDAVSEIELGIAEFRGLGTEPDSDEAIDHFRKALAGEVDGAGILLAGALIVKIGEGDLSATREAFAALDTVLESDLGEVERGRVEHLYGNYLMHVAPAEMRHPPLALEHWKAALELGSLDSAYSLGMAYRLGPGAEIDPVRAYAYFQIAQEIQPEKVQEQLDALDTKLSAADIEKANSISIAELTANTLARPPGRKAIQVEGGATHRPLTPSSDIPTFADLKKIKEKKDAEKANTDAGRR